MHTFLDFQTILNVNYKAVLDRDLINPGIRDSNHFTKKLTATSQSQSKTLLHLASDKSDQEKGHERML